MAIAMGVAAIIALLLLVVTVIVVAVWAGPARLSRTEPMRIEEGTTTAGPTLVPLRRGA